MLSTVDFISSQNEKQQEILLFLHDLMLSYEGVTSKIRYRVPFYYKNTWICYTNPIKKDKVELAFIRANEFEDPSGLLDFKDRKQVAGITISDLEEIPDSLEEVIQSALQLDATVKYASKRSKK